MIWSIPTEIYPYGHTRCIYYRVDFTVNDNTYQACYENTNDIIQVYHNKHLIQTIKYDSQTSDFEHIKSVIETNFCEPNYIKVLQNILESIAKHSQLQQLQYLVIAGSIAYGTNTDESDIDIRGWYFPPATDILGITNKRNNSIQLPNSDTVLYTFHKFMDGVVKCNPNFLEQLGLRNTEILYESELARYIRQHHSQFLSKRAYYTFGGYANNMLKQLEGVDKLTHRNRKAEYKMGKHASHLIRLYYTGIDILNLGQVITHRTKEHDLLMAIKTGDYPLDKLFELKDKLNVALQSAYESSKLPDNADMTQINKLVADLALDYLTVPLSYIMNWNELGTLI